MTKPYYQDDLVTLYHGDCREITEWLAADVLVTDPPYGIGYSSEFSSHRPTTGRAAYREAKAINGDDGIALRDWTLTAWGNKPALVFGRWDVPRPTGTRARLIWDKGNSAGMGDLSLPWGRSDEEIYVLGTGFVGPRTGSVVRVRMLTPGSHSRPDHPTPKPVSLFELLTARCPAGVIADPFAGSGPALLAASRAGRHAIGVEIVERHCETIARRFAQGDLFSGGVA